MKILFHNISLFIVGLFLSFGLSAKEKELAYLDSLYNEAFDLTGQDIAQAEVKANFYLKEAERLKDSLNIAYAYDLKGLAAFYADKLDSAFYYVNQSIDRFRLYAKDSFGLSTAIYNRSLYHDYLGEYKAALQDIHLSREIDIRSGDKLESDIFYYNSLAEIVFNQGNPELALRYQHRAWNALSKYQSWHGYMKSDMNIAYAWNYLELGILELAEIHAKRAYKIGLEENNLSVKSEALLALSEISLAKENYDLAINYARKALEYDLQYGDEFAVIYTEVSLAVSLNAAGKKNEAKALFDKVRARFMDFPNPVMHIDIAKKLYQYYKSEGDDKLALKYLEVIDQAKEKVNRVDGLATMKQFDQELENRKKELEKTKSRLQEEELNFKNALLVGLLVLLIGLLVFAGIIFLGFKKISRANAQLAERNLEIKEQSKLISQASIELKQQNESLEKLNQSKDRLFSILAHDLRQPFNQILGVVDLMDNEHMDKEEQKNLLSALKDSVNSTSDLVSNVLLWSKAQFAGVTINPRNISLANEVKRSLLHFSLALEKKKIRLDLNIADDHIIYFDPDHFASVFRNILSNAYKFSPKNSCISIWAEAEDKSINLFIKDQGIGMDQRQREQLMSSANLKSMPGTLNEEGIGIGMIIVNDFMKENKASYTIDSELDKGSTFILHLPKGEKSTSSKEALTDPIEGFVPYQ